MSEGRKEKLMRVAEFCAYLSRQGTHVTPHQLRQWEGVGILKPRRSESGQRLYTAGDEWSVDEAKLLLTHGFTRGQVATLFRDRALVYGLRSLYVPESAFMELSGENLTKTKISKAERAKERRRLSNKSEELARLLGEYSPEEAARDVLELLAGESNNIQSRIGRGIDALWRLYNYCLEVFEGAVIARERLRIEREPSPQRAELERQLTRVIDNLPSEVKAQEVRTAGLAAIWEGEWSEPFSEYARERRRLLRQLHQKARTWKREKEVVTKETSPELHTGESNRSNE